MKNALDYLLSLIDDGYDFADACYKAATEFDVCYEALTNAYDSIYNQ